MTELLHELVFDSGKATPDAEALRHRGNSLSYAELASHIETIARSLIEIGLGWQERVAVYLPKQFETVIALFATSRAGGVFVPINPLLKPLQVSHILSDCNARILITSLDRATQLNQILRDCHDLHTVIIVDGDAEKIPILPTQLRGLNWQVLSEYSHSNPQLHRCINFDIAAILYTSGSTGKPKGVVLSHCNMVTGAKSVASYLENHAQDRLLAMLPFSFDYGFSQLSTAFLSGASVTLMDYLLPRDIIRAVTREHITGLAAVPPLWIQLARLPWPEEATNSLRYITNSGGRMPENTLAALRQTLPKTTPYLMYGLTEAFRSTYLSPDQLDQRPNSIGKAIPNAEILVVREDGTPCATGEQGELVHRGPLVALGYWNDLQKTSERFRPTPGRTSGLPLAEVSVWSGDTVVRDEEGFLYFISRKDEMIKTSGYRVSPTEIEEVIYQTGMVNEVVALGLPHPTMGQAIVAIA